VLGVPVSVPHWNPSLERIAGLSDDLDMVCLTRYVG
jgi:hypothetical protein